VVLGGSPASKGVAPLRLLCLGNMIAAALSGASPAMAVAAGTRQSGGTATEEPIKVYSADDAATYFGLGSELHAMARTAFDVYPECELWCCPVAEAGGASAGTGTVTLSGTATSAGVLRVYVAGEPIDVAFASGVAGTGVLGTGSVAESLCTAINAATYLPATAQYVAGTGVVTVTAKNLNARGDQIEFRLAWVDGVTEYAIGASTTRFGLTAAYPGSGVLSAGAGADTVAAALAACAPYQFHRVAFAASDATNIGRVRDHLDAYAAATSMLWGQGIAAVRSAPATAITLAGGINAARVQIAVGEAIPTPPWETAACLAASRLIGDARSGGTVDGEATDPAANLNGLQLKSVRVATSASAIPTASEIESLLNYGCTPLQPSTARPGYSEVVASITSRHKVGTALNYGVYKTKAVTVTDWIAYDLRVHLEATYRGFRIEDDSADGSPPSAPRVTQPKLIRAEILGKLDEYARNGWITDVDTLASAVVVERDGSNRNRVNVSVPELPIPDLDIIGVALRQQ
jgi:phage tail sheath gpL-like